MSRIQFKDPATKEVTVTNGDYSRKFVSVEQPFEVEESAWPMLRQTGLFEKARPALPPAPKINNPQDGQ